ncbi:MAG: anti-sigma regulatory factor [Gracilimonas sp.]|uniref:anti-sigma regulatory factor n=1 Tax=Gracilimonas sp. TaxID=1974203 RepID=UPI0019BF744B|nr:anti-sigma regulatory factor [Gracilimonas sp.]MBD3615405.1 anti-sigma regulatory factor [Gracilimonas sp.]
MDKDSKKTENDLKKLTAEVFPIGSDLDLVSIRDFGRKMAAQIGFEGSDQTLIATALSEICRNVLEYAGTGEVKIEPDKDKNSEGILITVTDTGPGIEDVRKALQEGYSTGRGMGIGLPGTKRIMDKFEIHSNIGKGTTVIMAKWLDKYEF